jgi:hypothetical protein
VPGDGRHQKCADQDPEEGYRTHLENVSPKDIEHRYVPALAVSAAQLSG